jgi:hypothetical protein
MWSAMWAGMDRAAVKALYRASSGALPLLLFLLVRTIW